MTVEISAIDVKKLRDRTGMPFGECKGVLASHVLICERRVKSEAEKTDVLTHYLGLALGAVPSPDASSAAAGPSSTWTRPTANRATGAPRRLRKGSLHWAGSARCTGAG